MSFHYPTRLIIPVLLPLQLHYPYTHLTHKSMKELTCLCS